MPDYIVKPTIIEVRLYDPENEPDEAADVLSWCGAGEDKDGQATLGNWIVEPGWYVGRVGQQFFVISPEGLDANYQAVDADKQDPEVELAWLRGMVWAARDALNDALKA